MSNSLSDRNYLHDRHRLSHQQIDRWLGENRSKEFVPEKLKQLEAVKHFLAVTDLFTQNEISFISLKGPLLSLRIYGDPSVRLSHDVDILIGDDKIESAMKVLSKNGYQLIHGEFWPSKKNQQELLISSTHHLVFYNQETNHILELHWIFIHEISISYKIQKEMTKNHITEIAFAERTFTVFTKEFELLYLMIHGSIHGWSRLKWLVDIKEYPIADIKENVFHELVHSFKAERIVHQTNSLLKEYFNVQLSFDNDKHFPKYLIRYAHDCISNDIVDVLPIKQIIRSYRYEWLVIPSFHNKYRTIRKILFRPKDIIFINSSSKLMYFLYRPFSFIKRRIFHA